MNENVSARGVEDVERVVQLAKLDPTDLRPQCQTLTFADDLADQNNVIFLEMDAEEVAKLSDGQAVTFRGLPDDSAMLCTKERTFDIKEAETSNSLLVAPSLRLPEALDDGQERSVTSVKVNGVFRRYLELRPCKPRLARLRRELDEHAKLTARADLADDALGLTESRLLDAVQASEDELRGGLVSLQACLVGEKWYSLDVEYRMTLVSHILKFAEENSWSLSDGAVDKEELVKELSDLEPASLMVHVFDHYFDGGEDGGSKVSWPRLSRFFGEYLLRRSDAFRKEEFETMWRQAMPEEAPQPRVEDLSGLTLVDGDVIRYFPVHDLPESILERFAVLFSAKPRWSLEEISPFVEPLTAGKLDVKALLTKYARAVNDKGVKYFCAKHGK